MRLAAALGVLLLLIASCTDPHPARDAGPLPDASTEPDTGHDVDSGHAFDAGTDAGREPDAGPPICEPAPGPPGACVAPGLVTAGYRNDINRDMADYGLIFEDAGRGGCEAGAAELMRAKLRATLAMTSRRETLGRMVGPFQGWLEGAQLGVMFAAALRLGAVCELDGDLDTLLQEAARSYAAAPTYIGLDPNCGLATGRWAGGNGCMDDYTVAAVAAGWIAAYEHLRGRDATEWIATTRSLIASALLGGDSICIHDPSRPMDAGSRGPCNVTIADLARGAEVVSINHTAQNIAYGLGLMTLIAGATAGLEVAGAPWTPSADERAVALGLFVEGQRFTAPDGSAFDRDCHRFANEGGVVRIYDDADCGDAGLGYRPRMFPVAIFYRHAIGAPPEMGWGYDVFDTGLFSDSPDAFFNPGRRVYYGTLGGSWVETRPALSGLLAP